MPRHHKWLRGEIERWRSEGLVDEALAATLAERYPLAAADRAWSRIVFSAIGAVLVGLGVILFFAYNWDQLPKALKLGMIAAALLASHGAAIWFGGRPGTHKSLVEGLHILGTMMFGAGIWLVAQIYHIDEHYPNGILIWSLGALALGWALPSLAQGFLAVLLIAFWAGIETFEFQWINHWALPLLVVGVLPLAWIARSRILLALGLVATLAVLILTTFPIGEELAFPATLFTAVFFILAGLLARGTGFPVSAPILQITGFTAVFGLLFVFSFAEAVDILDDVEIPGVVEGLYFCLPLGLAVAAWLWILVGRRRLDRFWRWHWGLLAVSTLLVAAISVGILPLEDWLAAVPFNLIFLGHCLVFILQGSRAGNAKLVSFGCLLFAALALSRYLDLFDSLLLRSLVFLLLGGGVFLVGNFYVRTRRRAGEMGPGEMGPGVAGR